MPIEIRELIIKTTVSDEKKGRRKKEKETSEKEEIIAECMEKVSEILKYEKGR